MEHSYEYRLNNVYLRPLQHSDIEYLRLWRNDPNNTKFLNQIPFITEEMQENWYKRYLDNKEELCFAIVEDSVLHRIVGSLSLCNFGENSVEVGKVMVGDTAAHGKKVGANATKAAALLAHDMLGKHIIFLHVYEMNYSGVKAYSDAGFFITDEHTNDQGQKELTMQLIL